jgi:hypothetical protein
MLVSMYLIECIDVVWCMHLPLCCITYNIDVDTFNILSLKKLQKIPLKTEKSLKTPWLLLEKCKKNNKIYHGKIYHLQENIKMAAEITRKQYAGFLCFVAFYVVHVAPFCLKMVILVLEYSLKTPWIVYGESSTNHGSVHSRNQSPAILTAHARRNVRDSGKP